MIDGRAAALYERACRMPLLEPGDRERGPRLDAAEVRNLLPHRPPFLFVDCVTRLDAANRLIVGRHDVRQDAAVLSGHVPGHPVWPGVLQVEAVGQAGLCLARALRAESAGGRPPPFHLTDVLAARFATPVAPDQEVEIVAAILADGLFTIVVGQCLQQNRVCSAAALRGLEGA
ncbi:MAG: 3-hydroxyacyl-ACP dehydratase FabZ family protein [Vicinamibacterales bacterium]